MIAAKRMGLLAMGVVGLLGAMSEVWALSPSNVLVLYNSSSADSSAIASYYAQVHPGVGTVALTGVSTAEEVSWDVYLNTIRPQVMTALAGGSYDVIVTTKGLPLRINNPRAASGSWNVYSSLESELTRVSSINNRTLMGNQSWLSGNPLARNPYYYVNAPFSHSDPTLGGMYLTARLDGFTVSDVTGAIDRAQNVKVGWPGDYFLIDDDANAPASNSDKMESLKTVLDSSEVNYTYERTDAFIRTSPGTVLGYVSHGVNGGAPADYILNTSTGLNFPIENGAVFHTWESYNAYTFVEGPNPKGQGLVAQWLRKGGTAGTGNVQEPGADSNNVTNEDRMFQMLLEGYTWVEAAWNATRQLSYVNTVIGDPLMVWSAWQPGDATGDGLVSGADLGILSANFGLTGATSWRQGDFNGDKLVNAIDLSILSANFGLGAGGSHAPEPGTAALLLLSLGAILRRRKTA